MEHIVASRVQELSKESGIPAEEEQPEEEPVDILEEDDDSEEIDSSEETPEPTETSNVKTVKVRLADGSEVDVPESSIQINLKVDGEERIETLDKIARSVQKDAAASKRLEEAARRAQELEQRERDLILREQNLRLSQNNRDVAQPSASPSNEDVVQMARAVIEKMSVGTDEEAVEALAKVLGRQQTTQINPQEIATQAAQVAARQIEGRQAGEWFKTEYKEIVEDTNLFRLADDEATRLLELNPNMSYREAFQKSGDSIREWTKKYRPEQTSNDLEERRQRKKAAAQPVRKASAKASIGQDAPPPPTNSDIIADMRKRRGQR